MKKLLILLVCCLVLVGCGTGRADESSNETSIEANKSDNLYESERVFIKSIGNAEYPVPESWNNNSKVEGDRTYYYGDKVMLMVYIQNIDGVRPFESLSDSELDDYRKSLLSGLKSGFNSYRELSSRDYTGKGGSKYIRYTADVKLDDKGYSLDMIIFAGNDEVYCFGILIDSDSKKAYGQELRYFRENITMNVKIKEVPDEEESSSNNNIIYELKELYKQQAKSLSFSETDSEKYFEIVLKSSKEIAKRGENIELEDFVSNELFNPFVLSAGYLCNNYDEDTEYGKVGNMAFDLIGYIVAKDNENRDKILSDFDSIAKEHGMEIITLDETKSDETKSDESKSEIHTPTTGEKNALKSAKRYIEYMPFSYDGLIEQLEFEKYSHEEATYAADNCGADWNKQAEKKANTYIESMAFSKTGLIEQLEFEKFTSEQAQYAADNCGADWNEQAVKKAKTYMDTMSFSKDRLIEQLEFEGFTHEQAVYGVEKNGY